MLVWLSWFLESSFAGEPSAVYPGCAEDRRDLCPSDLSWADVSWIPESARASVRPAERDVGSGIGLDRAFTYTTGSWARTVAVIDSGVDWRDDQAADKVLLNLAELPPPQLQDGSPVPGGDLDGNGIVNVRDYAEDPRVDPADGVESADDRLDPSDLIAVFSDGVDDDANGYPDDIAGWDFFEHDNDPYAGFGEGFWDHGTGVAKTATAWAGDGGDLGSCPDCSLLPIRIGEAFVTDGDRVALAVAYASTRGVSAVSMAIGALTHPDALDRAFEQGDRLGVVYVGAGGDENTWHRNQPALADPVLFVKSIRALDRQERGSAYSFMATWNCNNFGPRMDLAAPSEACATGATAKIAGVGALVHAAADKAGTRLTASQIRALLRSTATDVAFSPEERERMDAFPATEGWDPWSGAGRVDAGAAVLAVAGGDTPPDVDIRSPRWFSWANGPITVTGRASGPWVLESGSGAEPAVWTEVARGEGAIDGVLASLTLSPPPQSFGQLQPDSTLFGRFAGAHQPLVQLRLRTGGAEDRTGVWVSPDPSLLPGFPKVVAGSVDGGAQLADLDGDGVFEVLVATASGQVMAWDGLGEPVDGWPVSTWPHPHLPANATWDALGPLREGLLGMPAVGDLDGDGVVEVVAGGLGGRVYAWRADGTLYPGFPVAIEPRLTSLPRGTAWDVAILGAVSLADIDGDLRDDIVFGTADQRVWALDASGEPLPGYPVEVCHPERCGVRGTRIVAPLALGDVDGDGDLDAMVATSEVPPGGAGIVFQVDLAEARVERYLIRLGLSNETLLPIIGEGHPSPVSLADLDQDGDLEIASAAMLSAADPIDHLGSVALDVGYGGRDRGAFSTYSELNGVQMVNNPAWGDVDGDGTADLVVGGASVSYILSLALTRVAEHQHGLYGWSGATGLPLPGFPLQIDSVSFLSGPALADIDGDAPAEVLMSSSGHLLYGVNADGTPVTGFPKFHGGWTIGGPAVGDIDGDGFVEVVLTTRDGHVFAWRTDGPADAVHPWPRARRDPGNTGNLETPLPVQVVQTGCGCAAGDVSPGWGAIVVLGLLRRRGRFRTA